MSLRPASLGISRSSRLYAAPAGSPRFFAWVAGSSLLIAAVAACSGTSDRAPADGPAFTLIDSAGVEIVTSTAPLWEEGTEWRLSETPTVRIGTTEGEEPYLLSSVAWVRSFGGGWVVGERSDATLRYFDAEGRWVRTVGGQGDGPSEFGRSLGMATITAAGLSVTGFPESVRTFDVQGDLVSGHAVRPPEGIVRAYTAFALPDGRVLAQSFSFDRGRRDPGVYTDSMQVWAIDAAAGTFDSLAVLPVGVTRALVAELPGVFTPRGVPGSGPDGWYYGWPERYEVQRFDPSGRVTRVIRRAYEPDPVTEADIAAYEAAEEAYGMTQVEVVGEARVRQALQEGKDQRTYGSRFPAYRTFLVGRAGDLWVERTDKQALIDEPLIIRDLAPRPVVRTWDVFDARGVWMGPITLPDGLRISEVGEDYLAGVVEDEFGVPEVRVFELIKG